MPIFGPSGTLSGNFAGMVLTSGGGFGSGRWGISAGWTARGFSLTGWIRDVEQHLAAPVLPDYSPHPPGLCGNGPCDMSAFHRMF